MSVINVSNLSLSLPFRQYKPSRIPKFKSLKTRPVLQDISFEVEEGDVVGMIGPNGAGKSTLLRTLAGVYKPDKGTITLEGCISPLLGLGAGFIKELSGIENIYINGLILGMAKKQIQKRLSAIIEFAGLEDYIQMPVKTYSSGMTARLSFSIAMHTDPGILLIDEILSTGDMEFQQKALAKMTEFMKKAKAILLCSHNMGRLRENCNKVLWLEEGKIFQFSDTKTVIEAYQERHDIKNHINHPEESE